MLIPFIAGMVVGGTIVYIGFVIVAKLTLKKLNQKLEELGAEDK